MTFKEMERNLDALHKAYDAELEKVSKLQDKIDEVKKERMLKMTKQFIDRVFRERIVDTSKYRYCAKEISGSLTIIRLPIADLDTTAAIDGWETVKTF